jgi:endonuclease/exonuclease/phosphatase (EEP) superfamily protein YafD
VILLRGRSRERHNRRGRLVDAAIWAYVVAVALIWVALERLTDRVAPATLIAFGPRWLLLVPALPLAIAAVTDGSRSQRVRRLCVLASAVTVLIVGVLDFRVGTGRNTGPLTLRLLTQNLGASRVTASDLDRLMRREHVDVAALQECPFYDNSPEQFGWHFYYGGDLCLVSRFPFTVLDIATPREFWRRGGREPIRFSIQAPAPFQLLNVHFATIRGGLYALERGQGGLIAFEENRRESWLDSTAARDRTRRVSQPLLVVGDFNLPVESAIYRARWGDLSNMFSSCGRGFGHTKFTRLFGIRIDHVLGSPEWACTDARVLTSPYGGDHAPLVVDLRLTASS